MPKPKNKTRSKQQEDEFKESLANLLDAIHVAVHAASDLALTFNTFLVACHAANPQFLAEVAAAQQQRQEQRQSGAPSNGSHKKEDTNGCNCS